MKNFVGQNSVGFSGGANENFTRLDIYNDISLETVRQRQLWGEQHHTPEMWMAILMEEVGESAKEVYEGNMEKLRLELIQVAAVVVSILTDLT